MKLLLLLALFFPLISFADKMLIVRDGVPEVSIVIPVEWQKDPKYEPKIYKRSVYDLAKRLAVYIKRSSNADLPIVYKSSGNRIEFVQAAPNTMDLEEFSFTFPDEKCMRITVGGIRALEFAVSEFLERYAGVRWVMPGELGEVVPKHKTIAVPRKKVSMRPSFVTRYLHGGAERQYYEWMLMNKGNFCERGSSYHNLWRLLSHKKYGKTNPEYFGLYKGKRGITSSMIHWQPCFTNPGAIKAILESIPENALHTSLCTNDGDGFCECEKCLAMDDEDKINFVGFPDRAKSYLNFCNQIAEARPNTKIAIHGYTYLFNFPQGMKLKKNLVPFICFESQNLVDPDRKKEYEKHFDRWFNSGAEELGIYDYLYGKVWEVPRINPRFLGNIVKFYHKKKVRHMTGEYYVLGKYSDAVKIYVWLKLCWDVNADIDAIIDDYCNASVGKKAAPYLKEYFNEYEKCWTNPDIMKSSSFRKTETFFNYNLACLEYFPDDFAHKCEKLLKKVNELADTPDARKRAKFYLDEFNAIKAFLL